MASNSKYKKGFIRIPLEKLVLADWNYKVEDKEKEKKLAGNIKRNGQVENIIVRELSKDRYEVVNGNHRLSVFKEIGVENPMVFNTGNITLNEAKRLAVETNETRFENDHIAFAELIAGLEDDFSIEELSATMPFDESQLSGFKELLDFNWDQFEDKNEKKTEKVESEITAVCRIGDKFKLGFHLLIVGSDKLLDADELIAQWEILSGEDAMHEETGSTYSELKNSRKEN